MLHLIGPLGFRLDDKYLKRAGLDYWSLLDVRYYNCYTEFEGKNNTGFKYFATTKAKHCYSDINYEPDCYLVFGKETAGLPISLLNANIERCIRIPMVDEARSLNLSNSVAIVVYEFLRQMGF